MSDLRPLYTVWGTWLVLMAGANIAAPLYAVYATRYGFSSLVLTAIFTVYAVVLVPTLLVFGRVSDRYGRRPVMLAGVLAGAAGLIVFAAARDTAWLFAARALQGLAVGIVSGAATAALVELDPERDGGRPALLAGLAQAVGVALGPLVAGPLAQWAPDPLRLSYLVFLAVTIVAAGMTLRLPEPAATTHREPWRIQRPRVPAEIRADFARVSLTAATVWASVALCLSIVPSYAADLLDTGNLALLGSLAAITLAVSGATQVAAQRRRPHLRRAQAAGLAVLAAGLVALTGAAAMHSLAVLLAGSIAIGAGHGVAFMVAQDELNRIAPPEHRGEVTAAFIGCIYPLVGGAVIGSGLLDERFSLTASVGIVSIGLAAMATAVAAWQVRARPARVRAHPAST